MARKRVSFNEIDPCKNCKNYLQYYIKTKRGFQQMPIGHCGKGKSSKMHYLDTCELWEDITALKIERKQYTLDRLDFIADTLIGIKQVLMEDSDNKQQ